MLLSILWVQVRLAFSILPDRAQDGIDTVAALILFMCLWAVWRLWRFTILPCIYPDDPDELPYWIPILGHGRAFFNNSNALLSRARAYLGNTNDPFAITLGGSKVYVITKSKDVADAYRNTQTLSFDEFIQAMMRACGNTESCVQAMCTPLPADKEGFANPRGKPLVTLVRDIHIRQLYPGHRLDSLENSFLEWFDMRLSLDQLRRVCLYATRSTDAEIVLPLMEWCSDFFVRAGQRAYFGDALDAIDPTLAKTFVVFDELSWQILYQYPDFLAGEMKGARNAIQHAFKKYIQLPQSQRLGDAWFIKAMEDEMRALNISEDDIAVVMVMIYWGIHTNTRKAVFWLLSYVLHAPSLIEDIRNETKPAFAKDGKINLEYLHRKCPQLDAIWNETIRMTAYSASVRFLTEDTIIGGKILRKGNRLMIPYRQLHFDQDTFGETAESFDHERFLNNKRLAHNNNWRPFGGGKTMCPGRFVAKRSVLLFVAMLVQRFDIEMDGYQSMPAADEGKPVLGIMSIKDDDDLRVKLTVRKMAA